jgi:hypothetical protein
MKSLIISVLLLLRWSLLSAVHSEHQNCNCVAMQETCDRHGYE